MRDLTDDEFTLLEIASHGESMIPIGRWERPLKALASKGLMFASDSANYVITESGRAALGGHKDDVDTAWAKAAIAAHNDGVERRMVEVKVPLREPGAYVFNGRLMFKFTDGSTIMFDCSQADAEKVVRLFNDRNTQKTRPGRSVVRQQR